MNKEKRSCLIKRRYNSNREPQWTGIEEVTPMWLKITSDIDLNMELELQGLDENTRDYDVQLYERVVRDALRERLEKVFAPGDVAIYAVDVGIAREKYMKRKAA